MRSILVFLEKKLSGGAELATRLTLRLLANEGFNLTVVTGAGNKIENMKKVKWVCSSLLDVPSKIHLWKNLLEARLTSELDEFVAQSDVVYIPRLSYPIIPLAKKYGKKVVVHLHDYQPISYHSIIFDTCEDCKTNLLNDMERSLRLEILEGRGLGRAILCLLATPLNKFSRLWIAEADEVICVSKRQREIIGSVAPELVNKLITIYNPLPNVYLAKKRLGDPTVFCLGGGSYYKGFDIFLKASHRLLNRGNDLRFLLTGDFKNASRAIIERLNKKFEGAYSLLGHLKHAEVLELHSRSHALLYSSISEEPLPYAIMEAMLSGTIPVASRIGGVPEIVEGSLAEEMLFEPGNADECADKVESLLAMSNDQIKDAGLGLRDAVLEKFDPEDTRRKLINVFSS